MDCSYVILACKFYAGIRKIILAFFYFLCYNNHMKKIKLYDLGENIVKALDLREKTELNIAPIFFTPNECVKITLTIDIPLNEIMSYISKWQSWQNAYKHRKR